MKKSYNLRPLEERFWPKVNKTKSCWLWVAGVNRQGYGKFSLDGKTQRANRVSWEIHNDSIPDGLCVLHKCDNTSCVNPDHLFLGTNKDNTQDMLAKGRHSGPTGELNRHAKLTEKEVLEIRRTRTSPPISLAAMFGISPRTVRDIVNLKTWRHI